MDWIDLLIIPAVKVVVVFTVMVLVTPVFVLIERKVIGRIQQRPGPNRVGGRFGLLQTIVDGVKLLLKEDLNPTKANHAIFILAPLLTLIPALLTITIVPFGPSFDIEILGKVRTIAMGVADLPVGILLYFAVTSVGVYGIVLAGWSSHSKYSLLGGIRSSAQLISYELTLGMSLIGVLLITGSFRMSDFIVSQEGGFLKWHVFCQPLGALLFLIGGFAETNRLPFDLPEGESELGAGFHTEYSSMKFAMFFMAEYMNVFTFSAIMTTVFLGGYHGPIPIPVPAMAAPLVGAFWFFSKILLLFFFFVWVRGTLPRLRYDQLMNFGWKVMLPLALANVLTTAAVYALGFPWPRIWLLAVGVGIIYAADRFAVTARKRVLAHVG